MSSKADQKKAADGLDARINDDEDKEAFSVYARRFKRSWKHPALTEMENIENKETFVFSVRNLQLLVAQYPESTTAKCLLESASDGAKGKHDLSVGDTESAAAALSRAFKKHWDIIPWSPISRITTMEAMRKLHSDTSKKSETRADALLVNAILLFKDNVNQAKKSIVHLKLAQQLVPMDPDLPFVEGSILFLIGDRVGADKAFQRATELGYKQLDRILFDRSACQMNDIHYFQAKGIPMLEEYVRIAERHAKDLPEAYYILAFYYASKGPEHLGAARRLFDQGETAMQQRLPCFANVKGTSMRERCQTILKRYIACGNGKCSVVGTRACTGCGQISYCSEECQLAHWKAHKTVCKKHRRKNKPNKNKA